MKQPKRFRRIRYDYLMPDKKRPEDRQPHITFWADGSLTIRDGTPDHDDDTQQAVCLTADQFRDLIVKYEAVNDSN